MTDITWTLRTFEIASLTDYFKNPRSLTKAQFDQLKTSIDKFGMIDKPIVNADAAHTVIGGHQRLHVLRAEGVKQAECWYPSRELTAREVEELNIRLNKNTGAWDFDVLANSWEIDDLVEWGFAPYELGVVGEVNDPNEEWKGMPEFEQEDKSGIGAVHVHFQTKEDREDFFKLIGQTFTDKTRAIWYPEAEKTNMKDYYDES